MLAILWLIPVGAPSSWAQRTPQVKVLFEFSRSATQSQDAMLRSTERRTTTATGLFTIVQNGGESTLLVASQVPYAEVAYYRDYLSGAGYLASGITFRDVGTALKVRAVILPHDQLKIRVTPTVSWFADDRSGTIEVNEASTELIVANGRPVVFGGATTQVNEITRRILGVVGTQSRSEARMIVTATILE